jgi:hypothetical protein
VTGEALTTVQDLFPGPNPLPDTTGAVVRTLNVDQKYALLYAGARAAGPGTQAVVNAGTSLAKHRMVDVLYGLGYQKK